MFILTKTHFFCSKVPLFSYCYTLWNCLSCNFFFNALRFDVRMLMIIKIILAQSTIEKLRLYVEILT